MEPSNTLLYLILQKEMIQTRKAADSYLIATDISKHKPIKKEPLRPIGKLQVRKFLKKKLIDKQQRKITVDSISEATPNPPPSPRLQRSRLLGLLDQTKLTCPVCLEILVRPLLLECGHVLCLQCFEEYSNFSMRCTTCRVQMTSPIQIEYKALEEWIKMKVDPLSEDGVQYWCRQGEFQEWESNRRVNPWLLIPGDQLDFCTIKGWHPATFKQLFTNDNNELMARVSMKIEGQVLVEIELLAFSRKLAPLGFFTKGLFMTARTFNRTQKILGSLRVDPIVVGVAEVEPASSLQADSEDSAQRWEEFDDEVQQPSSECEGECLDFQLRLFDFEMNNSELDL